MANKKKQNKPQQPSSVVKTPAELPENQPSAAQLSRRGGRETVDALVVAFVLAFLIRTFVAEMFVIPTGSMAPTLMGRHKDAFCTECGVRFKVNSSDDRTEQRGAFVRAVREGRISARDAEQRLAGMVCVGGECPQCRNLMPLEDPLPSGLASEGVGPAEQTADYSGDRLLVAKYAYSFHDPERWDVAVFKYPGNSQTNYIKRVTGLPNEDLRIFQGDLFVRPTGTGGDFEIARKPPEVVLAMKQFVHDTHHESAELIDAGWPLAWSGEEGWTVESPRNEVYPGAEVVQPRYAGNAPAGQTRWLRFRNTPPGEPVWAEVRGGGEITVPPTPQLVTDFTPYNTRLNLDHAAFNRGLSLRPRADADLGRLGLHWVGDLILEADLKVEAAEEVSLDLVEAGDHYGVSIDPASGAATLWRRPFESDERETLAETATPVRAGGSHSIRLANVDSRLLLWVDGDLVEVDGAYATADSDSEGSAETPRTGPTDEGDLAPAGVAVSGGTVEVERLRVWRDGYYIATSAEVNRRRDSFADFTTDYVRSAFGDGEAERLLEVPVSPDLWYVLADRRRVDFTTGDEQLFMMGDNSGWSLDARLWAGGNGRDGGQPGGAYLERSQLVGKAVCVYWPHAWYSVPFTRQKLPAWPNFGDMRLVR